MKHEFGDKKEVWDPKWCISASVYIELEKNDFHFQEKAQCKTLL